MKNSLEKLFSEFNKEKIKYCVRGRYKHLPKTLNGGDIDLLIDLSSFGSASKIIKKFGFKFYPYTKPNLFYYFYDGKLGLIQLDILVKKIVPIKKYKNFYIPSNEKPIPNRKTFLEKIKTGLVRRIYWFFRGKVIVFEGPDGSGKTSNAKAVYNALERFPIKKEMIHFATKFVDKKPSGFKRLITRFQSILKVYKNKIMGRISITDRYIYLTFRKKHPLLKKLLSFLSPRPDIVFVMKASPEEIRKRKKGQRDQLSTEMIKELYKVYDSIPEKKDVDTKKLIKDNLNFMVNDVLRKVLR